MSSPDSKKKGGEKSVQSINESGRFLGSGIEMAVTMVIMYFIGDWMDGKWQIKPWGMVGCLLFGAAAGLVRFIREVMAYTGKEAKKDKQ